MYHHGKSAAGGHYTVAVRQQLNSNSWIHIDDTAIRPVAATEVSVEISSAASRLSGNGQQSHGGHGGGFDGYPEKGAYLLFYSLVSQ